MDSSTFLNQIKGFYELRKPEGAAEGAYSFTPGLEPTYWSSCYPALAYSLTGILKLIDSDLKTKWLEYLQKGQDPTSGFFKEPITKENSPKGPVHNPEDLLWHGATFIIGAMHVLGGKPIYPFKAVENLKESGNMTEWLESLDWENPWKAGNFTYDIGCIMGSDYEITGNGKNIEAMDEFFHWHDDNTDSETGWWNPSGKAPLYRQQFGGYHSLMVYWMFDREVPDPEKMILSSLSLQSDNGSFMNHGCCGDMDVIDTVVTLSRQYDICHNKVRASVEKFYPYLMSLWDPDGGFISLPDAIHIDLGWKLHEGRLGKADACSTYFRTFTLSLVDEIMELGWTDAIKWKHIDGFCHGRRPSCLL
jgi:hypothetical protein